MSHTSPATYLVWAILSSLLGIFLVFHLWSFDRFKCLKWNTGPTSGAFKRVMTYSYLLSVPLIISYSIGFSIIKYQEGYTFVPGHGIIPTPYQLWSETNRRAIFPLSLLFSIAWGLEMVTHLEELCFWLFLVNAGSASQDWFKSWYFRTWLLGACIAIVYMPLVTIFTRSDPLKNEAFTFLAGSLGSFSLTLWFLPVLWTFPSFLANLKAEGVDMGTVVRLTKFSEMNSIRVLFRFMFTAPFIVLGIDGVRNHQHVNESAFWTDLLAIIAAMGCIISSGLTLVIFFPRSIEGEIQAKDVSREEKALRSNLGRTRSFRSQSQAGTYLLSGSPVKHLSSLPSEYQDADKKYDVNEIGSSVVYSPYGDLPYDGRTPYPPQPTKVSAVPLYKPNRRLTDEEGGGVELGNVNLTERNLALHTQRTTTVNPLIHGFTSPIDLAYGPAPTSPRYPKGPR
ncbi:hypothetical protein PUNSTDRAFT_115010 [Punctularia strigosozonata HHB-11173 SS5]|uniref:uncharacterized protein n=1 Tax=Punctularia strigosozonata (strain HHB-11173) TaxID=741275 RepID=UPI000441756E|nr:uncharacterized protein PUNSTDRAFT_115010 [Punctularia strigosozonata HHB-11173 SS5]EIN06435.1 hypothetical protein PUNSTDRAFT_115010 [Punctularia strigosozonata HHB-11173 SS5]